MLFDMTLIYDVDQTTSSPTLVLNCSHVCVCESLYMLTPEKMQEIRTGIAMCTGARLNPTAQYAPCRV